MKYCFHSYQEGSNPQKWGADASWSSLNFVQYNINLFFCSFLSCFNITKPVVRMFFQQLGKKNKKKSALFRKLPGVPLLLPCETSYRPLLSIKTHKRALGLVYSLTECAVMEGHGPPRRKITHVCGYL